MSDEKGRSPPRRPRKPRAHAALPGRRATPLPGYRGEKRSSTPAELRLPSCPALTGTDMAIFSVYVVNKAGGLIYQLDHYAPRSEAEKTFSFPLDLVLKLHDERVVVAFGQRDNIRGPPAGGPSIRERCLRESVNSPVSARPSQGSTAGRPATVRSWGCWVGCSRGSAVPSSARFAPFSWTCCSFHQRRRREREIHCRWEGGARVPRQPCQLSCVPPLRSASPLLQ
ncbi:trafficking protein particle complex subunit 4 isoform X2 [Carettochelys insculpta]|uniref:trafficking protein particle complex subunit 4 isoform X2 n=1 Tax=Carettochelys insculpta TaxID=44489 RepID=UPI003EBC13AD